MVGGVIVGTTVAVAGSARGVLLFVLAVSLGAQERREQALALVISAQDAQFRRAGSRSFLALHSGEILFERDTLASGVSPIQVAVCAEGVLVSLAPNSEAEVTPKQLRLRQGPPV